MASAISTGKWIKISLYPRVQFCLRLLYAWAYRHMHQQWDILIVNFRIKSTTGTKLRERRRRDLISDLIKIIKLHMVPWGRSAHKMESDLHQNQGNSGSAQKCQSRQDNPVVVVDGERSKSEYAYEKMSNFSLYRISWLTDDPDISDFFDNIYRVKEDLATTQWWAKCDATGARLTSAWIVRIYTQWIGWAHQYALCLKGVFDTIEAEDSNDAITVEQIK